MFIGVGDLLSTENIELARVVSDRGFHTATAEEGGWLFLRDCRFINYYCYMYNKYEYNIEARYCLTSQ